MLTKKEILLFWLSVVVTGSAFGGPATLDQPIPGRNYSAFVKSIRDGEERLSEQERLDLSIAVNYLEVKGRELNEVRVFEGDYEAYLYGLLRGSSPRKVILIAAGMMLAECAGDTSRNDPEKRTHQRQRYIKELQSRATGWIEYYGKGE